MARRSGFLAGLQQLARESARLQRQAQAAQRRQLREQARQQRDYSRHLNQLEKEQRQQYLADRQSESETATQQLTETMDALRGILEAGLQANHNGSFSSLRLTEDLPPFYSPAELTIAKSAPKREDFITLVKPIGFFEKIFSRTARYEVELQQAEARFTQQYSEYVSAENERLQRLDNLMSQHERANQRRLAEIQGRNTEVDELERSYENGDPSAVIAFCSMILEGSQYPDEFPQDFRMAFVPESSELVIDYELPTVDVVPGVIEHRYVKSKDIIEEKPRKAGEIKEAYQDIVAAITLRTLHEVLVADQKGHLAVIVFNGFVNTVDRSTGKDIRPYLISVRVTKERFQELDLRRIDKKACLRNLGAHISAQPAELLPVRPLIEFDMVDKRFIEGGDVLLVLESRPNLMDFTPFEFETLVSNLFTKMGLETKQTRSSRDGGVDAVAYDMRPVIGGKVVIQAKRYRHTVGVSAVRDLFGTMNHEGANKGILVTTSSFGPDAYEFISGKPIELLDGGKLLYLLEQEGIQARIVFPVEDQQAEQ